MKDLTLKILQDPHPVLRQKAEPVEFDDPQFLVDFGEDMVEMMNMNKGAGLAAPQIGASIRMIVFQGFKGPWVMCNPRIVKKSGSSRAIEGCLSIPNKKVGVVRAKSITVKYQNQWGEKKTAKFKGDEARVIQHEVDHLNGILITDYAKGMETVRPVGERISNAS
jgi:peptide deformylase